MPSITLNNIQRYSSKIVKNKLSRADIADLQSVLGDIAECERLLAAARA